MYLHDLKSGCKAAELDGHGGQAGAARALGGGLGRGKGSEQVL